MHCYTIEPRADRRAATLKKDILALYNLLKADNPELKAGIVYLATLERAFAATGAEEAASKSQNWGEPKLQEKFAARLQPEIAGFPLPAITPEAEKGYIKKPTPEDITPFLEKITQFTSNPNHVLFLMLKGESLAYPLRSEPSVLKKVTHAFSKILASAQPTPGHDATALKVKGYIETFEKKYQGIWNSLWTHRMRQNLLNSKRYKSLQNPRAKLEFIRRHAIVKPGSRTATALHAMKSDAETPEITDSVPASASAPTLIP